MTPAFNPFDLFRGNPRVIQLMAQTGTSIEELLVEDQFVSEFKKTENA